MSRSRRILFSSLAGLVLCLSSAVLAKADPMVFTIANPNQFALPGQTVTVFASATNAGPNTDQIILTGFNNFAFDFTPLALNFGDQQVTAGSTLGPLSIATLTIPAGTPFGTVFSGSASISWQDLTTGAIGNSGSIGFSVSVGAPVPEPTTLLLFGSGLAALGSRRVRRRFTQR